MILECFSEDDAIFLQGMLEGMTNVEAEAYSQLRKMGASKLKKVILILTPLLRSSQQSLSVNDILDLKFCKESAQSLT